MRTPTPISALQALIGQGIGSTAAKPAVSADDLAIAIARSLQQERLTIFLGAGLSYASGFPTWSGLLSRLSDRLIPETARPAFDMLAGYDSPLVVARYLKSQMQVGAAFHTVVQNALYSDGVDYLRANSTLDLVVAIVERASALGTRLDLITYNFDDLLESALRERHPGIEFETIANDQSFHCVKSDIRIHHVHGYLPSASADQPILPPPTLILSEDDFHGLMNDPRCWANRVQFDAFGWQDCLFIGLSMTDPNLRRVLDYATPEGRGDCPGARWIITRRYQAGDQLAPGAPILDEVNSATLNQIKAGLFASLGAHVHEIESFNEMGELALRIKANC